MCEIRYALLDLLFVLHLTRTREAWQDVENESRQTTCCDICVRESEKLEILFENEIILCMLT